MSPWLYLSFPMALVALGIMSWLSDIGEARKSEAKAAADNAAARLLEARNAALLAQEADCGSE